MNTLVRQFFQGFFRLSFLDDAGEESFTRVIFGVLAGFVAVGLWLPRIYAAKYGAFSAHGSAELYRQMLLADQLLVICLPMFIVAFAMALVCHSLFPDETDYRILVPLPISRRVIFSAKLLAMMLFASIFILTTNLAIGIPFSAVSTGRWATHYWPIRAIAQITAGVLGSVFAVAAVIAVQGLIVVLTPREWLRRVSVITQTGLVCILVVLLPVMLRVPAQSSTLHDQARFLYFVPPVWFLGVQEILLGNREAYFRGLTEIAVAGTILVGLVAFGCYAFVYRRFDRVILRSETPKKGYGPFSRSGARKGAVPLFRPEYGAIRAFTLATLGRSSLHQLVLLGIAVAGLAITLNSVLGASSGQARVQTTLWAPFVIIFASVLGLRMALLLPVTRPAAWVFRLTEEETRRTHQLLSVEHVFVMLGVLTPLALALPFQLAVLGVHRTLLCIPLTFLMGLAFVEIVLARWHRLPFTCSYLPGKRPFVHDFLLLLVSFFGFTTLGWGLAGRAMARNSPVPVALVILFTLAMAFRWVRLQSAVNRPLEFEDEPPESTYGLRLNS
jgi:hypothetical protein